MKSNLLICIILISFNGYAQPQVHTTKKRNVFTFYTFEINRSINDGWDTAYYVSFQNREYLYTTDLFFQRFSREELKELADGFFELCKKEYLVDESTIYLKNSFYLRKKKLVFKTFIDLVSPDNKYNGVQVSKVPDMYKAIYNELGLNPQKQ